MHISIRRSWERGSEYAENQYYALFKDDRTDHAMASVQCCLISDGSKLGLTRGKRAQLIVTEMELSEITFLPWPWWRHGNGFCRFPAPTPVLVEHQSLDSRWAHHRWTRLPYIIWTFPQIPTIRYVVKKLEKKFRERKRGSGKVDERRRRLGRNTWLKKLMSINGQEIKGLLRNRERNEKVGKGGQRFSLNRLT